MIITNRKNCSNYLNVYVYICNYVNYCKNALKSFEESHLLNNGTEFKTIIVISLKNC